MGQINGLQFNIPTPQKILSLLACLLAYLFIYLFNPAQHFHVSKIMLKNMKLQLWHYRFNPSVVT